MKEEKKRSSKRLVRIWSHTGLAVAIVYITEKCRRKILDGHFQNIHAAGAKRNNNAPNRFKAVRSTADADIYKPVWLLTEKPTKNNMLDRELLCFILLYTRLDKNNYWCEIFHVSNWLYVIICICCCCCCFFFYYSPRSFSLHYRVCQYSYAVRDKCLEDAISFWMLMCAGLLPYFIFFAFYMQNTMGDLIRSRLYNKLINLHIKTDDIKLMTKCFRFRWFLC